MWRLLSTRGVKHCGHFLERLLERRGEIVGVFVRLVSHDLPKNQSFFSASLGSAMFGRSQAVFGDASSRNGNLTTGGLPKLTDRREETQPSFGSSLGPAIFGRPRAAFSTCLFGLSRPVLFLQGGLGGLDSLEGSKGLAASRWHHYHFDFHHHQGFIFSAEVFLHQGFTFSSEGFFLHQGVFHHQVFVPGGGWCLNVEVEIGGSLTNRPPRLFLGYTDRASGL